MGGRDARDTAHAGILTSGDGAQNNVFTGDDAEPMIRRFQVHSSSSPRYGKLTGSPDAAACVACAAA